MKKYKIIWNGVDSHLSVDNAASNPDLSVTLNSDGSATLYTQTQEHKSFEVIETEYKDSFEEDGTEFYIFEDGLKTICGLPI